MCKMGRSKFPGKPSKFLVRDRICVLNFNQTKNRKCRFLGPGSVGTVKVFDNCVRRRKSVLFTNEFTNDASENTSEKELHIMKNLKYCCSDMYGANENKKPTEGGVTCNTPNSSSCATCSVRYFPVKLAKLMKRKTVTFKSILETNATSINKAIHNPVNKGPLVSIMKKDCPIPAVSKTKGDNIVRPSRLTKILKSYENVDKRILHYRTIKISDATERAFLFDSSVFGMKSNRFVDEKNDHIQHITAVKNFTQPWRQINSPDSCTEIRDKLHAENCCNSPSKGIKSNIRRTHNRKCFRCWLGKLITTLHIFFEKKLHINSILMEMRLSAIDITSLIKVPNLLTISSMKCENCGFIYFNNYNSVTFLVKTTLSTKTVLPTQTTIPYCGKSHIVTESTYDGLINILRDNTQPRPMHSLNNTSFYPTNINPENTIISDMKPLVNDIGTEPKKREFNNIRGPRVKYVCRSASIALGQQIARFPNNIQSHNVLPRKSAYDSLENKFLRKACVTRNITHFVSTQSIENHSELEKEDRTLNRDVALGKKVHSRVYASKYTCKDQIVALKIDLNNLKANGSYNRNSYQCQETKKIYNEDKNCFLLSHRRINCASKKKLKEITKEPCLRKKPKYISVDFFEASDFIRSNQSGHGLLLTVPTSIHALCFMCGSMDLQNLIFCASCCEPFHSYCVPNNKKSLSTILDDNSILNKNTDSLYAQLNWVCFRCTVCCACNMSSGTKIECQKCTKSYHAACMGKCVIFDNIFLFICKTCFRCEECFERNVYQYFDNQLFCKECFEKRCLDSYCSSCNISFKIVSSSPILKCYICDNFVHSKCEGLTEEQLNIQLSMSDNSKFVCKQCSLLNGKGYIFAQQWKLFVYEQFTRKLLDVLKLVNQSTPMGNLALNKSIKCICKKRNKGSRIVPFETCRRENLYFRKRLINNDVGACNNKSPLSSKCLCFNKSDGLQSLLDIRYKINNGRYTSLFDFDADMIAIIESVKNDELMLTYKEILFDKFPWIENEVKISVQEENILNCNKLDFQSDELEGIKQPISKIPILENRICAFDQEIDKRICLFCHKIGDKHYLRESRLLYYGKNTWVHANCALWSSEVYEEVDGTLKNVQEVLNAGRITKCSHCKCTGASVKCFIDTCYNFYHFQCAKEANCVFKRNRTIICQFHNILQKDGCSSKTRKVFVLKSLYIETDERKIYVKPSDVRFLMGSLSVMQLGYIHSTYSDTHDAIIPVDFICFRLYWSCKYPWRVVKYKIHTYIDQSSTLLENNFEDNFTIDHSTKNMNNNIKINQVKNLNNNNMPVNRGSLQKCNKNELVFNKCNREEQHMNSSLLPPEIEEAIFEDLPHDIFDGISVLDIFPKCAIYDDLLTYKNTSDSVFLTQSARKSSLQNLKKCPSLISMARKKRIKKYAINCTNCETPLNVNNVRLKHESQCSCSDDSLNNSQNHICPNRSSSITGNMKVIHSKKHLTNHLTEEYVCDKLDNTIVSKNKKDNFKAFHMRTIKNKERKPDAGPKLKKDLFKLSQFDGSDDTGAHFSENTIFNIPVKCAYCNNIFKTLELLKNHILQCDNIFNRKIEANNPINLLCGTTYASLQCYKDTQGKDASSTNITKDPKQCLSGHTIPQNLYVSNYSDYKDSFYTNTGKLGYNHIEGNCGNENYNKDFWQTVNCIEYDNINKNANKAKSILYDDHYKIKKVESKINSNNPSGNKMEYNDKNSYYQIINEHFTLNSSNQLQPPYEQDVVFLQQEPAIMSNFLNPNLVSHSLLPSFYTNLVQYATIPTNVLLHGSVLQIDTSATPSGLQILSIPTFEINSQLSPPLYTSPNPPQLLNVGAAQIIIGNSPSLELFSTANQLLVATPVHYGLETVVQNTVMSSQQFVSTATQSVLSQNSSFSATTTQVFQSSKFEPTANTSNECILISHADQNNLLVPQPNIFSGTICPNIPSFRNTYVQCMENTGVSHPNTFVQQFEPNAILPLTLTSITNLNNNPMDHSSSRRQLALNFGNTSYIVSGKYSTRLMSSKNNEISSKPISNAKNQVIPSNPVNQNKSETNQSSTPQLDLHFQSTHQWIDSSKTVNCLDEDTSESKYMGKPTTRFVQKIRDPLHDKKSKTLTNWSKRKKEAKQSIIDYNSYLQISNSSQKDIEKQYYSKRDNNLFCKSSSKIKVADNLRSQIYLEKAPLREFETSDLKEHQVPTLNCSTQRQQKKIESGIIKKRYFTRKRGSTNTDMSEQRVHKKNLNCISERMDSLNTNMNHKQSDTSNNILRDSKKQQIKNPFLLDNNNLTSFERKPKDNLSTVSQKALREKYRNSRQNNSDFLPGESIAFTKPCPVDKKKKNESCLIYEIRSEDGFMYKSKSIEDIWETIFKKVQNARRSYGLSSLPSGPFFDICGNQILGLKTNTLKYIIEQMPVPGKFTKYMPTYHRNEPFSADDKHAFRDNNCAESCVCETSRCKSFERRSMPAFFKWLMSVHRKHPNILLTGIALNSELNSRKNTMNLPISMKYRILKKSYKKNIGVFRSGIHGCGLFCLRNIEAGEMVIEYSGELIRSTLSDKRELFYNRKGIGCYMFKIDDSFVVDATMQGNAARFINHSCDPNCYSKVVDILGHKRIIIFALRHIIKGEELTYDYKFPYEEVKIPCFCGSKKCRMYLN